MNQSAHDSQLSHALSGMSTPTANAARLANNKRIIFTDQIEMYKNAEADTATGAGVNTAGAVNQRALIGTNKKENKVAIMDPGNPTADEESIFREETPDISKIYCFGD
jgi:hypothetical protein